MAFDTTIFVRITKIQIPTHRQYIYTYILITNLYSTFSSTVFIRQKRRLDEKSKQLFKFN